MIDQRVPAPVMNGTDKWALITGASSGIGEQFAYELSQRGTHSLILVARRAERLQQVRDNCEAILSEHHHRTERVEFHVCDLSDSRARLELCREIRSSGRRVDLLINNAGLGSVADFLDSPIDRQLQMIELNSAAPVDLIAQFKADWNTVINVCSIVAFGPLPGMATYAATKAFLLSFSIALQEELRGSGRRVVALCPGLTESEFHVVSGLEKKMDVVASMPAERVVQYALDQTEKGKSIVVPGAINSLGVRLVRLLGLKLPARVARFFIFRHRASHSRMGSETDLK